MATRLLVLSCSCKKQPQPGLVPAMQRYDGPSFQVLRRFQNRFPTDAQSVKVHILSAEYGLISHDYPLPAYDRRMTAARARELRPSVIASFRPLLMEQHVDELFIAAGRTYLEALQGYEQDIPPGLEVIVATGSQGGRLAQLHSWLHRHSVLPAGRLGPVEGRTPARFHGVELGLSPDDIYEVASCALADGGHASSRYQTWYVPIAEQRVAPKWLVSVLTGVPVRAFRTAEAVRLLTQLGIEVRRV